MRRKPVCAISTDFREKDAMVHKSFTCELITPMFGGDSKSWEIDEQNPVRGQSVKGQLRFWWRTMQKETDVKTLLNKENCLWGGKICDAEDEKNRIKSPVSLSITEQQVSHKTHVQANASGKALGDNNAIPSYVLFPVTETVTKGVKDVSVIEELAFTLNISFPRDKKNEVMDTLKLWILFGGVGARTRRGTGSLYCEELLREFQEKEDVNRFVEHTGSGESGALGYPRIKGAVLFAAAVQETPVKSWKTMLESYGRFRQDRPRSGRSRPGRSYWPEPDAIRRITGVHAPGHEPEHPDGNWFPRAAFGLPILTKFSTSNDPGRNKAMSLEPDINTGERLPSPVILKVIQLPGNKILKIALVLNQTFPEQLILKDGCQTFPVTGRMLPFHPGYENNKIMRQGSELNGETIYENLAGHLNLQEVE
ncbi:MAG: type III-B CRISPR module RAMP protein Cmr1 [Thermodesulfobacteriota bacterium]|nr:type III-B CRISPR module RAMP protein Cmr1 [Thermodesulfobacteriota bacterium]